MKIKVHQYSFGNGFLPNIYLKKQTFAFDDVRTIEVDIKDLKTLNLTLKKKWFDMIASGEKKEEYREIKPYWAKRLAHLSDDSDENDLESYEPKQIDIVSANNGYSKDCPNIKWIHEGITIGEGKEEWGAEPGKKYFILEIGELICQ